MLNQEECWDAVQRRDASQDGRFFVGVLTTGVFCRPSCTARHALRKNVRFYAMPADAARDGLRPCLRCHPLNEPGDDEGSEKIRNLCRHIQLHCDEPLSLDDLAGLVQWSASHLQRRFLAAVGVSPKQYAEACRMRKLKRGLRTSKDVTEAIYDAGYGSSSRVYERTGKELGMTPKQYRLSGKGVHISYASAESPLGRMMIGATDRGLCFLQFGDSEAALLNQLRTEYAEASIEPMEEPHDAEFDRWMESLQAYLAGQKTIIELPLDVRSTAFQTKVWRYLQTIPYGEVQSYGEVAAGIGQPRAARAVGHACATNRVALVIPCHRVIRGGGDLGGYRWGLPRKRALMDLERRERGAQPVALRA
jgi:AraC family transcriptional regulator of adaptative response/methylated-DNA-[protein]-cysteine methyltransferase